MAEFINTIDSKGDDVVLASIIDGSITEFKDDVIKTIKNMGFCYRANLKNIALPNVTQASVYMFFNCTGLTSLYMPNITSIGDRAFQGCTGLTTVDISKVTSIGDYAFSGCTGLTSLYMPNVTSISGNPPFQNCTGLTSVTFGKKVSLYSTFKNCINLKTINVPWAEGEVSGAPWGATNATINYNYTGE